MTKSLNRLYYFIDIDLFSSSGLLRAADFESRENKKGRKYYTYELKKSKQNLKGPGDKPYKLKKHHLSFYKYASASNPSLSQYHYTAYFYDEDKSEHQLHVHFDHGDQMLEVQFAPKVEEKKVEEEKLDDQWDEDEAESPLPAHSEQEEQLLDMQFVPTTGKKKAEAEKLDEPFKERLVKFAYDHSSEIMTKFRDNYQAVIPPLEEKYSDLEEQLKVLSMNKIENLKERKICLEQIIATLTLLLAHHERYAAFLKIFKHMKFIEAPTEAIRRRPLEREALSQETEDKQSDSNLIESEAKPVKKSIGEFIQKAIVAKQAYLASEGEPFKERLPLLLDFTQKIQETLILTEDPSYLFTQNQLWQIHYLMKQSRVYGKKVLTNLLLAGDFQSALALKSYICTLRPNIYILAVGAQNESLLEFLIEHVGFAKFSIQEFRKKCKQLSPLEKEIYYKRLQVIFKSEYQQKISRDEILGFLEEESAKDYVYRILEVLDDLSGLYQSLQSVKGIDVLTYVQDIKKFRLVHQELTKLVKEFDHFLVSFSNMIEESKVNDKEILNLYKNTKAKALILKDELKKCEAFFSYLEKLSLMASFRNPNGMGASGRSSFSPAMTRLYSSFIAGALKSRLELFGLNSEEINRISDRYLFPRLLAVVAANLEYNMTVKGDLKWLSTLIARRMTALIKALSNEDMEFILERFQKSAVTDNNVMPIKFFYRQRKINGFTLFYENPGKLISNPVQASSKAIRAWDKIDARVWQDLYLEPSCVTLKWSMIALLAIISREQEFSDHAFMFFLASILLIPLIYPFLLNNKGWIDFDISKANLTEELESLFTAYFKNSANEEVLNNTDSLKSLVCTSIESSSELPKVVSIQSYGEKKTDSKDSRSFNPC